MAQFVRSADYDNHHGNGDHVRELMFQPEISVGGPVGLFTIPARLTASALTAIFNP
jgi:hypothetical protein